MTVNTFGAILMVHLHTYEEKKSKKLYVWGEELDATL